MRSVAILYKKRMQQGLDHTMKRYKIGRHGLIALIIITFATLLRLTLDALGWPFTNSDEGTMGIMARHIAFRGEHPVLFYGQNYMGAMEAYLGAMFFHLFGSSLFTLRLSVILLDALFLASMYLLTSLLYTKNMALVLVALLSLGSNALFMRELYATGGSTQTLLFGSLSFLLAAQLAFTRKRTLLSRHSWLRYALYTGWGLVVGLGVWSDSVVLPFFLLSGLLLLLFCWRDIRTLAPLCLLLGFIVGVFPLLAYNIQAPLDQNSFAILLGLFHGTTIQAPHTLAQYWLGIKNTLQISLPTATGDPFCPVPSLRYASAEGSYSTPCQVLHTIWGLGYLLLWGQAIILAILGAMNCLPIEKVRLRLHLFVSASASALTTEKEEAMVRAVARCFLLASAGLAVVAYAISSAPLGAPQSHARYLVGLLMVTPALLWPLWIGAINLAYAGRIPGASRGYPGDGSDTSAARPWTMLLNRALLLLIGCALLLGTISTFAELPATEAANRQQDALIADLLQLRATHIYTDYWTCDRLAFLSREEIICGVVDNNLQPSHNRDGRYYAIVSADPRSAYVFLPNSGQLPAIEQKIGTQVIARGVGANSLHPALAWQRLMLDGYVVFVPE